MTGIPQDYSDPEIELWLLTFAYFHQRDYLITETEILESIPSQLLEKLPTRQHLVNIVWNFIRTGLLENRDYGYGIKVRITDEGIFQFRKFVAPLYEKIQDEKKINTIIDSTVGNPQIKRDYKEFFKRNKNLPREEFDNKFTDFVLGLGKDAIFFVIRLIIEGASSGGG